MYTWSIKVAKAGVTRAGSEKSCERSNSCIMFDHLVFVHKCRSILKFQMKTGRLRYGKLLLRKVNPLTKSIWWTVNRAYKKRSCIWQINFCPDGF